VRNFLVPTILLTILLFGLSVHAGELVSYQGRLTDSAGSAVPDGDYELTFSLWNDSTGGQQQWSETHTSVSVSDGLLSVILGKDGALDATIFEIEPLFLQIQIGLSNIIEPRTRLTSAPTSVAAKKVAGDIETGEGYLNLKSSDSMLAVSISSEGKGSPAFLRMYNPDSQYPEQKLIEMSSEADGGKFNLFAPGDYESTPTFTIGLEPMPFRPPYLGFYDPSGSLPHDPYVKMGFDPSPFRGYLEFYDPGSGWTDYAMVKMGTEPSPFHKGFIAMYNPEIGPPPKLQEMGVNDSSGDWESFYRMYSIDPVDEGMTFEISNTINDGANLRLFNAQPGRASYTVIDMYYDSTNGGGTVKCQSDAENSWGSLTGRDFSLGNVYTANVRIDYGGNSYFSGNMGLGVQPATNILEVKQNSFTDPIADAWTVYSSQRWKKNIRTIESALDKVDRLRGVSFDWVADDKPDIGMIAEEVGEVFPEVVAYEENGIDAKSIDYNRLTAVLVEAVKELKSENEELRKRIEILEQQ